MPIYRGQTRMSLRTRRKVHLGSTKSRSTLMSDYIQEVKEEGREDDITIHEIDFESERQALEELWGQLLNVEPGKPEPRPYSGYDWSAEEAAWLGELPDKEIARRTGVGEDTIRTIREKLGLSRAEESEASGFSFSDQEVLEIRRRHKNTKVSYAGLSEEHQVSKETIARLVKGETYDWVPHPTFSEEENEQIEKELERCDGDVRRVAPKFSASMKLLERRFKD